MIPPARVGLEHAIRGDLVERMLARDFIAGARLEHAHVNCYLIEDQGQVTIVDTGLPASWRILPDVLAAIGSSPAAVQAVVITHAHFDHLGFARAIHEDWGVPVHGHPDEAYLAAHDDEGNAYGRLADRSR